MKLKNCESCGKPQTTKNAVYKGRGNLLFEHLLFNCTGCGSTNSLFEKAFYDWQEAKMKEEKRAA